ncbi:hypothetical protein DV738_g4625, partial [Chaetothyriales sp. CBS 135597]
MANNRGGVVIVPLEDIPSISSLYRTNNTIQADLTKLQVDAIVNAANESLLGGGGVDSAIHAAAGPELVRECRTLGGCATGSAKITSAYGRLPGRKVIHAVGPVYHLNPRQVSESLLRGCYRTALELAVLNGCRSVAFSAISTGVYGYPSLEAAGVALDETRSLVFPPTEEDLAAAAAAGK